jgi:tetratricopeptide (TPR) repeat protein
MAGRYGMSFAKKAIEQGDYEDAVASASREIDEGNDGPEPLVDRATALELLERYAEAVSDFERAIAKNRDAQELDPFVLDDAYFSALLASARAEADGLKGAARLARYAEIMPDGAHDTDVRDWQKRLRGELPSLLDKTKDLDQV